GLCAAGRRFGVQPANIRSNLPDRSALWSKVRRLGMSSHEPERAVQQSILDRLVDLNRDTQVEAAMSRAESVRRLKASLRRDIEWLLNTRRTIVQIPEAYSHVKISVLAFGMPDVTSMRVESPQDEKRLLSSLEQAISAFEPRLVDVRVRPHERP